MSNPNELSGRIGNLSCVVDGLADVVAGLVNGADGKNDAVAYACSDHLKRLSSELDGIYVEVSAMEKNSVNPKGGVS